MIWKALLTGSVEAHDI